MNTDRTATIRLVWPTETSTHTLKSFSDTVVHLGADTDSPTSTQEQATF
jgi:hypothetical protein